MRCADRGKVSTMAALCTFERLLHVVTQGRLVNLLASAVLLNTSESIASPVSSIKSSDRGLDDDRPTISQVCLSSEGRSICCRRSCL